MHSNGCIKMGVEAQAQVPCTSDRLPVEDRQLVAMLQADLRGVLVCPKGALNKCVARTSSDFCANHTHRYQGAIYM